MFTKTKRIPALNKLGLNQIQVRIQEIDLGEIRQPVKQIMLPDLDDLRIVLLGKTTLARKVYNSEDIKLQFDHRMWVTIS